MPITRRQFELGIDADIEMLMRRLVAFLEQHQDEAFNFDEVLESDTGSHLLAGRQPWDAHLKYALDRLIDLGVVKELELGPTKYFAIGRVPLEPLLKA